MGIFKTKEENVENLKEYVYPFIESFLEKKALNSSNTAMNYESDIRQFFLITKGKTLEVLTKEDLILTNDDVENYQLALAKNSDKRWNDGKKYSVNSIARKISSVKKLYNKFEAKDFHIVDPIEGKIWVKEAWFKVDKLKGESKSHGVLEWDEVEQMMELVSKERKGDVKACLLETAVKTAFRETTLLNLTWDRIERHDNTWVLVADGDAIMKGKKVGMKSIDDELYEKLMKLKERYYTPRERRIFPLDKKTVVTMMQRLREEMNLDDDIVFHSLKKCGAIEAFDVSGGNIMDVADHCDHESPNTAVKFYLNRKKKFSQQIGLKIGKKIDLNPLRELSHEQLINLIEKSSRGLQFELINNSKHSQK